MKQKKSGNESFVDPSIYLSDFFCVLKQENDSRNKFYKILENKNGDRMKEQKIKKKKTNTLKT